MHDLSTSIGFMNAPYPACEAVLHKEGCGSTSDNWWLRSPGNNADNAGVVNTDGNVNANGDNVDNPNAVRPDLLHRSKRAPKLMPSMQGQRYRIPALLDVSRAKMAIRENGRSRFRSFLRVFRVIPRHPQPMALSFKERGKMYGKRL